ncbi:TIGR03086 family metal-binding protein [Streptomyces sp. H10-C2]|uniref:TIGR03086 family metal-binding protein n=1 Tax=unclassified Streptomyces TaxID=2593676 RepID=UPI0024B8C5B0|nr:MULTISPECIES: TIGR03086 family metal-binding protein [unclassified Streptomyces]MDJ0347413.1 TIGR03086 family metal-binding protein [Streptomyces sp. PH10-H1]MDJ0375692.1 TIGR03086 family metal-binding protein [Streptomyces sp. H10-C2]
MDSTTDSTAQTPFPDLGPAAHAVAQLLPGITDEQLDDPTPCPKYAVRELLGHVVGLSTAFRDAARKEFGPTTGTPPGSVLPALDDDWPTAAPQRLEELVEAWQKPGAREGDTQAGGVTFPAAIAGRVALNELLIHGWDLARATGQDYAPTEANLNVSYELLAPSPDDLSRDGVFGPAVAVPGNAPLLDRIVALSGRRPDWKPGH